MSAFELWWNNVGSSISGVCKEDARHGWDAAIKSMEAQPQADNISRDAMSRLKEPPVRSDDTRHPY